MRHNSYSLITDTKRERFRPKIIKVETGSDAIALEKPSSRIAKNYNSKPESNYGKFKKTVVKKRSSNMLFSQLGFATENKPSTRFDALLNNRKPNESGSINLKTKGTYLMGRLSPHSQASIGENFRFDFLDHSTSGPHQNPSLPQTSNTKKSNRAMPYIGIQADKSIKQELGSKLKQTAEDLDHSDSSTSLSHIESNVNTLSTKMQSTIERLAHFLDTCRHDQQEKIVRFEALARENGILKEKIKALERKLG